MRFKDPDDVGAAADPAVEALVGPDLTPELLTGQGRPKLRLATWRVVWGALHTNTVYAARYRHLTTRETNITPTQAQSVIAAAILRHLHAVITTGQSWDPVIAAHGVRSARGKENTTLATREGKARKLTAGASPTRH